MVNAETRSQDAMEALVDLLLLAECDALVGKFSSNIDRLA